MSGSVTVETNGIIEIATNDAIGATVLVGETPTEITLDGTPGPQGPQGPAGAKGDPGPAGSIEEAVLDGGNF